MADPVVRATHIKRITQKTVALNKLLAQVAVAREAYNESIRDAYADGVQGEPIRRAAGGISKDRAWRIKNRMD